MNINIAQSQFSIGFDPLNKKQAEEAKRIYQQARAENRQIFSDDFSQEFKSWAEIVNGKHEGFIVETKSEGENTFPLRILDETGDRRLIWDLNSPLEMNEAQSKFLEFLDKGWKAYAINKRGEKSYRIFGFDPELQEIFIDEGKTNREKLSVFVKKVSEVRLTPKTRPG